MTTTFTHVGREWLAERCVDEDNTREFVRVADPAADARGVPRSAGSLFRGWRITVSTAKTIVDGLIPLSLVPAIALVRGYVLSIVWEWFVVPIGAVPISIPTAIGLAMMVNFVSKDIDWSSDKDKPLGAILGRTISAGLIAPWLLLLVSYVVHQFQ